MQKTVLNKLVSTLFFLIILLNITSPVTELLDPLVADDGISIHHIDSALIKTTESAERSSIQRIIPNIISDNYFSYKFITSQYIKSQKIFEIIFTTSSESNIRSSSFLQSHN